MRLVQRRRLIKKTRAAAEAKVAKVVYDQLQSRFRSLKRELRKGNLRKRLKKFYKSQALAKAGQDQPPADPLQNPGMDPQAWQDWMDSFVDTLVEALEDGADEVGTVESEIWTERGYPKYTVTPQMVIDNYMARYGRQITDISDDTRDAVINTVEEWYNTNEGLPSLISSLTQHFDMTRAELIAATEMGYVSSEISYEMMIDFGINKWIWDAFDDWITCPLCESLNGQVFNVEDKMPPDASHPRCRCGVLFADDDGIELMVRPAGLQKDINRDARGRFAPGGNAPANAPGVNADFGAWPAKAVSRSAHSPLTHDERQMVRAAAGQVRDNPKGSENVLLLENGNYQVKLGNGALVTVNPAGRLVRLQYGGKHGKPLDYNQGQEKPRKPRK